LAISLSYIYIYHQLKSAATVGIPTDRFKLFTAKPTKRETKNPSFLDYHSIN
jgi:hypothetical protein